MFKYSSGGNNSATFDENYGFTMKIPTSIDNYEEFAITETVIDLMIKENEKVAAKAENLRKYYVAVTRASESLHLIMANGKDAKQIVEFKQIFDDFQSIAELPKHTSINLYKEDKDTECKEFEYSIHTDSEVSYIDDYTFDIEKIEKKFDPNAARYIGTVEALEKEINFSSTKLAMLQDIRNKEKFKEVYIFGLPILKPSTLNYDKEEYEEVEDNKTSDGTDYGIFFHALMENIGSILSAENTILTTQIDTVLSDTALQYLIKVKSGDTTKLTSDLQKVIDSEFISRNKQILLDSHKEFDLKLAFGDHTLMAIYDAISFDGDTAEIWDWKTNAFNGGESLESKASKYSLQMNMYALFAFRYNEKIDKVNSRLFFINKLESAKNDEDWIYSKNYTRADVTTLQIEIAELIGVIRGRYPNTYPVSPVDLSV
jgi:ATP-dependent exoDNAse (exonuclease V) beta subunit